MLLSYLGSIVWSLRELDVKGIKSDNQIFSTDLYKKHPRVMGWTSETVKGLSVSTAL